MVWQKKKILGLWLVTRMYNCCLFKCNLKDKYFSWWQRWMFFPKVTNKSLQLVTSSQTTKNRFMISYNIVGLKTLRISFWLVIFWNLASF